MSRVTGEAIPRPENPHINYFAVAVEVPQGWLDLNDGEVYRVHAESFGQGGAQQYRRQRVTSPYVGGQFLVNAVEDLVQENLTVYVTGYDQVDLQDNIDNVVAAFTQIAYQVRIDVDSSRRVWNCDTADYTVEYEHVGMHNRLVMCRFNLSRMPTVYREIIADG